ncbi:hypothetical protein ACTWPT_26750 [Nonomuraea sp. 3N208]|uniref:hypothetical protein n=1 Tax=Nonomuraea sp. 3N208 TaxID=3457421 RepID=UPI003FD31DEB
MLYTTGLVGKGERYVMAVLTTHPAGSTWSASVKRITTRTSPSRLCSVGVRAGAHAQ